MVSEDVLYLTVEELSAQIRVRKISPVELTESYLARLERLGPRLGAVATLTPDLALKQARQAEKEIAAGHSRGPLHGIPYGAKDLLATSGIPTTWGAPPFRDQVFHYDATVIRKLRDAGAVLVAKLSMIELAGGGGYSGAAASLQGPSHCPYNLDYWAGGSSSGPGAAVPSALVGFAIGSETLGSIITPSAFSGVSGLRPTYGRVSRHGAMALSWTMDKLGPMCRSAIDCGLVLSAIAGKDAADATSLDAKFLWGPPRRKAKPLAGKRLGVIQPDFQTQGDPEVGQAFRAALDVLRGLGAKLEETELPDYPYTPIATTLYTSEAASIFRPFIESGKVLELLDESQKAGLVAALSLPAKDYLDAFRLRAEILPAIGKMFERFDALVSPSRIGPPPRIDADFNAPPPPRPGAEKAPPSPPSTSETRGVIGASNVAGLPALSVPCGFTKEKNLPIGIQFVADALSEEVSIECAAAFQSATTWHRRRPNL
ncbi:MAG TPA: amidase [Candidatus Acidoferrales bacterium]|nr:amidase [Candidatus Acidoferrales bacterium]